MSYSEQQHLCIKHLKEIYAELGRVPLISDFKKRLPNINVVLLFGSYDGFLRAAGIIDAVPENKIKFRQPVITTLDIETKPLIVYTFGLFDQNIGLNQIKEDWSVLAWAAKRYGHDEVIYQDLSNQTDYTKDEIIIYGIWEILNESDIIITQNGMRFDIPKLNERFTKYKLGPPSPYKHIDTYRIKKKLGLTSKKLAYTTEYFNERFKKLEHSKFPGFSLWSECLKGNQEAWAEMKEYNIHDVLSLEELYFKTLRQWDSTINHGVYTGISGCCPNCGSTELVEKEYSYTKTAAYQNLQCKECKTWCRSKDNELPKSVTRGLLK